MWLTLMKQWLATDKTAEAMSEPVGSRPNIFPYLVFIKRSLNFTEYSALKEAACFSQSYINHNSTSSFASGLSAELVTQIFPVEPGGKYTGKAFPF